MADDPKKDPEPKPDPEPKQDPPKPADDLGDAGKKALDEERKARRDAEKALKDVQTKLKDLEDKDKSDAEKLREQVETLTKERDQHATAAMRQEVALSKGLNPAQAKRLVGGSKEELEADADEILEAFPASGGAKPPPSKTPKPDLKGGGDPTGDDDDAIDVKKLAEAVPRP